MGKIKIHTHKKKTDEMINLYFRIVRILREMWNAFVKMGFAPMECACPQVLVLLPIFGKKNGIGKVWFCHALW